MKMWHVVNRSDQQRFLRTGCAVKKVKHWFFDPLGWIFANTALRDGGAVAAVSRGALFAAIVFVGAGTFSAGCYIADPG